MLRNPGKSLILLSLVFILGSLIMGAVSARNAINNTEENLRRQLPAIVMINEDLGAILDYFGLEPSEERANRGQLTLSDARAIGNLPQVQFFDYTLIGGLESFDLKEYDGVMGYRTSPLGPTPFTFYGTSHRELFQIETGIMELVEGRQFLEDELAPVEGPAAAIVSEAFAEVNGLSIGSVFNLYDFVFLPNTSRFTSEYVYEQFVTSFTVIGMFDIPLDPAFRWNNATGEGQNREDFTRINGLNRIFVPNWIIEADAINRHERWRNYTGLEASEIEEHEIHFSFNSLFIVEPADMEAFTLVAQPYLPNEFYRIQNLSSRFAEISASMEILQDIADWVLTGSIGATLLVLSLLLTLFLYDRRHEIGIYLALGEKRSKIIFQLLLETMVISMIGITLSVFSGHLISSALSQTMISSEVANQMRGRGGSWQQEWTVFDDMGIPNPSLSQQEMMDQFDTSIGASTILLFCVVGIGVVMLSTAMPVYYVVSLNPNGALIGDFSRNGSKRNKQKRKPKQKLMSRSMVGVGIMFVLSVSIWIIVNHQSEEEVNFIDSDDSYLLENEYNGLTDEQQEVWDLIESRIAEGYETWSELVDWSIEQGMFFAALESGERLDEELRMLINQYGLVGEYSHATAGIGSSVDPDEVLLFLHFEELGYNETIAELSALDRNSNDDLLSWLAYDGEETLAGQFETIELLMAGNQWEIEFFHRFKPTGKGVIRIVEFQEIAASESEESAEGIALFERRLNPWIVGEHIPEGRYVITTDYYTTNDFGPDYLFSTIGIGEDQSNITFGEFIGGGGVAVASSTVDLINGEIIYVTGNIIFTPTRIRQLSTSLGSGHWEVGIDTYPGQFDLAALRGTGRIRITRGEEIIYDQILGSGGYRYYLGLERFLADENASINELGTKIELGIPRMRVILEEGDLITITRLTQVHFDPILID